MLQLFFLNPVSVTFLLFLVGGLEALHNYSLGDMIRDIMTLFIMLQNYVFSA